MFLAMMSIPSQVIPKSVELWTGARGVWPWGVSLEQNWSLEFQKLTPSISVQLKLWYTDQLRWKHGLLFFVRLPRIRVRRQKHRDEKCLPGSAMTWQFIGSLSVGLRAQTVKSDKSPAGKPPPTSNTLISCPCALPICMHFLASRTAFPKAEDPCMPDPQWKCMPFKFTSMPAISSILCWIISSVSRSSPNLPEKGVARLSRAYSLMAIRHSTSIWGAYWRILVSQSMLSAVVNLTPVLAAQMRSRSFFIGFEYTMSSSATPACKLVSIYAFEAQSMPVPLAARSEMSSSAGHDLMAQWGFIQGRARFHAVSFLRASVGLQTRMLELSWSTPTKSEIYLCCCGLSCRESLPLAKWMLVLKFARVLGTRQLEWPGNRFLNSGLLQENQYTVHYQNSPQTPHLIISDSCKKLNKIQNIQNQRFFLFSPVRQQTQLPSHSRSTFSQSHS